jgi:hypothetical protein
VILLLIASRNAKSDPFLYLTKINRNFQLKYFAGNEIRLRLHEQEYFTSGIIEGFTDSSLIIHSTEILLASIAQIDIQGLNYSVWSYRSSPGKLIIAGLLLPLVELGNTGRIGPSIGISSLLILSSGITMRLLEPKFFIPGGRNKMNVVNAP